MTSLYKIYGEIFNKSRFLAQDYYFTSAKINEIGSWQKLDCLDDTIQKLPNCVQQYIAYLCTLYKRTNKQELSQQLQSIEKFVNDFNPILKKACEVYAIGLLVCDDLLTRINILNINKKSTRITIPTISYNNACNYLSWLGNVLLKGLERTTQDSDAAYFSLQLTSDEIETLNSYSTLLITVYNSSALGIFRKQPVRRFNTKKN